MLWLKAWKARIAAAPSRHVFCALGGSGSTALRNNLRRSGHFTRVGNRPDVAFLPPSRAVVSSREGRQLLDERGYACPPGEGARREFFERSRFELPPGRPVREGMLAYLESAKRRKEAVLLDCAAGLGFFSQNAIGDVVFLVRHPLHAYVSWTKRERHLSNICRLGEPNSERSILYWAGVWNAGVREYLRLREKDLRPVLLRYEYAMEDALVTDEDLLHYLDGWTPDRRNPGVIEPRFELLLREQVAGTFTQIYDAWEL